MMHSLRLIFSHYGIIHLVWKNARKSKRGFIQTMFDMLHYAEREA